MSRAEAARLVSRLTGLRWHVATAESLTGGLIAASLTAVPGASACVAGGFVTYTDEAKHRLLGVDRAVLAEAGAVSETVAVAMARGARARLRTELAVSATGYAGPGGDAGLVWLGIATASGAFARQFRFAGDRAEIREASVGAALALLA